MLVRTQIRSEMIQKILEGFREEIFELAFPFLRANEEATGFFKIGCKLGCKLASLSQENEEYILVYVFR